MININGLLGAGWNNLAAMNDMRLSQALSVRNASSYNKVDPVKKPGSALSSEATEFLKDYKSNLTDLEKLAKELVDTNSKGVLNTLSASSSDTSVLTAKLTSKTGGAQSYSVDVKQLSQSQINIAEAVQGSDKPTASGVFSLETRAGVLEFEIDSSQTANNRDLLTDIADAVNAEKFGVMAQVTEKDGKVSLSLSSDQTGAAGAFRVSGSFAEQTGLSNTVQAAQDAIYTVDKKGDSLGALEYTSSTNNASIGAQKIDVAFQKAGKAEVTVGPDSKAIANKVGELVDQFNKTISFLDKNADRGIGVLQQLRNMASPPTGANSMKIAGIGIKADGTYTFDKDKFMDAMAKDPKLATDIIGGNHGVAQGVLEDVRKGMNAPSGSLVGQQKQPTMPGLGNSYTNSQFSSMQSTFNMLSSYTRSGAYNMSNYYAVGALMNFNA